jgi:hypothetical protein
MRDVKARSCFRQRPPPELPVRCPSAAKHMLSRAADAKSDEPSLSEGEEGCIA